MVVVSFDVALTCKCWNFKVQFVWCHKKIL